MLDVQEIAYRPAADAFAALADEPFVAWLDSAASSDPRSRYSYLCIRPFSVIEAVDGRITIGGRRLSGDPFAFLQAELARWRIEPGQAPVPFAGGAVGFLGYELGGALEVLPARHPNSFGMPDMSFGFYDVVLAFDAREQNCWLLSSGFPETEPKRRSRRAAARADEMLALLRHPARPSHGPIASVSWTPELSRSAYEARVGKVLEYIRAGDIFQANFTARSLAPRPPGIAAAEIYRKLRALSPAPFAAFLGCGAGLAVTSASPERFLRLDPSGQVETRPIKGTRPRGADPETDRRLRAELSASPKDRAENLMIVDLMRSDLGKVAEIGSISVPTLCEVESFATVHHLVSAIEAQLRPGLGPVDLLRAAFPGGSVTGAPKIRAMEIIDELEEARRGPYCGSIAWIGFDGAMDSSMVIRTLVVTETMLIAQAGGGIVADSDPAGEYEEMQLKLRPIIDGFGGPSR